MSANTGSRHAPEAYFSEDAARIAASLSGEADRA
jgi:hypothetical protein